MVQEQGHFVKGDWSAFNGPHGEGHSKQFHTEGGFIKIVCTTCGVYQPLAELEAGIKPVERSS